MTSTGEQSRDRSTGWKVLDSTILFVSLLMVAYQFLYVPILIQSPLLHANTHLGFGLFLTFLIMIRKNHRFWQIKLLLAILSLICVSYVHYFYMDLMYRISDNTNADLVIAVILLIVCMIACYEASGMILPIICSFFVAYAFWGYLIPGPLQAMQFDWDLVISRFALSFGIAGIYGYLLSISATLIFIFMVFASLVSATGAVDFFNLIGDWVSKHFRSGPAMAAVVTSALVGSVSGLPGPNVMITGSFTIPSMKKSGYSPEQAGGIETAASTCGPLVPPVMGIVAFVMVGFTGIPYKNLCFVAILPAVLYIFSMSLFVTFQAGKLNIQKSRNIEIDKRELLLRAPIFLAPMAVISTLLLMEYPPMTAGFWATITLVLISLIRPKTRPSLKAFVDGLCKGAEIGAKVAPMCAVLGIMIVTMTMTGLGIKLPTLVTDLAGNSLLLILIITWAICIVLGCGLPTSAAYLLVAMTCAPILLKMGISLLQAHLFVLYAAVFANITPPVAIPAIFAAQIAGGNYMKTAFQSAFAGSAGFLLPFLIIFVPSLTFNFENPVVSILSLIACPLIFLGLQAAIVGFYVRVLSHRERFFVVMSPIAFLIYVYTKNSIWFVSGLTVLVIFTLLQVKSTSSMLQRSIVK